MRRLVFLVMLVAVLSAGCRKKHSMEFGLYKADFTSLVDRNGDDAYLTPEMDAVVEKLKTVNPETVEAAEAQALVARIASEKSRVQSDKEAKAKAVAEAAKAPPAPAFPPSEPTKLDQVGVIPNLDAVDAGAAADAGVKPEARPEGGMTEAAFRAAFGACFEAARPVPLPTGPAQAYQVKDRPDCAKYGAPTVSYYFVGGKLGGTLTEEKAKAPAAPAPGEESKKTEAPPPKPQVVFPPAPESVTIP